MTNTNWRHLRWREQADAVTRFRSEHGAWPLVHADDPAEHALGRWLQAQRANDELPADRDEYFTALAPDWRVTRRTEEGWFLEADRVTAFQSETGTLPKQQAADASEHRLARWLSKQRTNDTLPADRAEYLDERIPGWDAKRVGDEAYRAKVSAVAAFHAEHGHWPTSKPHNGNETERKLGQWLVDQRKADLDTKAITVLDENLPGWFNARGANGKWLQKAEATAEFVNTQERLPRKHSADARENMLGEWVARQRRDENHPDRIEYLDKHIPGWRGVHDAWHTLRDAIKAELPPEDETDAA